MLLSNVHVVKKVFPQAIVDGAAPCSSALEK